METSCCSKKAEVEEFLKTLKEILTNKDFDIDKDLYILFRKKNESIDDPYITSNTLAALNYDKEDVKNELLKLKIFNYVGTLVDIKDISGPRLYVFIKEIGKRDVYIKIKIREFKRRQVFCISFHFARFKNSKYPYKGVV